jgi:aspartate kinase
METQWKVAKFGGTSNKNAKAMLQSCRVVQQNKDVRLVVVSAMAKTTAELRTIASLCAQKGEGGYQESKSIIEALKSRHLQLAEEVKADSQTFLWVEEQIQGLQKLAHGIALLGELSNKTMDRMMAFGEKLSSKLFVAALASLGMQATFFDVQEIMVTSNDYGAARPLLSELSKLTQEKLKPLTENTIVVTQGFIGRTKEGETTTLGLEGSDYTAALLAEALEFHEIQIWTDVDGIFTTDPRIVDSAVQISELDFEEAEDFSFFGAKVLHPKTLMPAKRKNIPVYIGNSQKPEHPGSRIVCELSKKPPLRSMALKDGQQLLRLKACDRGRDSNYYQKVFQTLWHLGLESELVQISNGDVITVLDANFQLTDDHRDGLQQFDWSFETDFSLLTLIGSQFSQNHRLLADIFATITQNIHGIFYGANGQTLSLLLDKEDSRKSLQKLHQALLEGQWSTK